MAIMKRKQKVSDEIPTASMADIAFLLLVFFLTTTVFNEERGLPIVLPEQSEEQDVSPKNLIFFIVQPDGRVVVRRGESEQEHSALCILAVSVGNRFGSNVTRSGDRSINRVCPFCSVFPKHWVHLQARF